MPTKREKQAAYNNLNGRKKELFDAVKEAGAEGIKFPALKERLKVNSPNMLYGRISELKESGLIKVVLNGRLATYFCDYHTSPRPEAVGSAVPRRMPSSLRELGVGSGRALG